MNPFWRCALCARKKSESSPNSNIGCFCRRLASNCTNTSTRPRAISFLFRNRSVLVGHCPRHLQRHTKTRILVYCRPPAWRRVASKGPLSAQAGSHSQVPKIWNLSIVVKVSTRYEPIFVKLRLQRPAGFAWMSQNFTCKLNKAR